MPHATSVEAQDTSRLPDTLLAATIRGNIELPQMFAGHVILAGQEATRLVLETDTTWDDCMAQPNTEQIYRVGQAANRAHAAYGIPYRFVDDPDTQGCSLFHPSRIRTIHRIASINIARSVSAFGAEFLPAPDNDDPAYFPPSVANLHPQHRSLMIQLFDDNNYRPAAATLTAMWDAAADALHSDAGRELSKHHRNSLSPENAETHPLVTMNKLASLIAKNLKSCRVEIQEKTGVAIDKTTIDRFVLGAVFKSSNKLMMRTARAAQEAARREDDAY